MVGAAECCAVGSASDEPKTPRQFGWRQRRDPGDSVDMLRPAFLQSGKRGLLRGDHGVGIIQHRTSSRKPIGRGMGREWLQIEMIVSHINWKASSMVVA